MMAFGRAGETDVAHTLQGLLGCKAVFPILKVLGLKDVQMGQIW